MAGHSWRQTGGLEVPPAGADAMHNCILDFVCFDARLIVEVDGSQHALSDADRQRDAFFREQGFMTLRFWNDEIERNLDFVCLSILSHASGLVK